MLIKWRNLMKDKIQFAKVRPDAIIPSKREEDGAYDIYACFDEEELIIEPNQIKLIPTGIASAFDKKYRIVFQERGSTGVIGLKINAGLIDSGYRDKWFICVNNTSKNTIVIDKKTIKTKTENSITYYPYTKALAQFKIQEVPDVDIEEVAYEEILKIESKRGLGSLGSSNK
jgi:dUTP pyrophosphatase